MKKLLVASAALAVLIVTPALAADMPVKAPPPTPAPAPTWTGFYLGVEAGGAWSDRNVKWSANDPATQQLFNGVALPGNQPLIASYAVNRSGGVGGAEIGYNWQSGSNVVMGVEADISAAHVSGTATATSTLDTATTPAILQSTTSHQDTEWYGTLRGRLGWLATPNLLLFGTGGLAYGRTSLTANETFSGPPGGIIFNFNGFSANCTLNVPCFAGSGAATKTGWTAGGGVEWQFAAHWSAKIEYLFVDLGTQSLIVSALNTLNNGTAPSSFTAAFRNEMNVARLGLNYRF
jgi:outer membrane immunogenic protein